jgi:hypothetical protein
MFEVNGLSVKFTDAQIAFGFDLAAGAVRAQPASLNIDNLSIDRRLAQENFPGFKAPRPSHRSSIPTTEAPAPQLAINTRAMQVASRPTTEFISPSVDAFAVSFESTPRRMIRFRLPTVPLRGGRFTD